MTDDGAVERAIEVLEQLRGKVPGIEAQIEHLRSHHAGAVARAATAGTATATDVGIAGAAPAVATDASTAPAAPAVATDVSIAPPATVDASDVSIAAATAVVGNAGIAAVHRSVASGAIANSVVVTGRVEGGVYLGPQPRSAAEALTAYRRVLVASARHLPLRGVDVGAADPSRTQQRLELAAVYVDLETRPSRVELPAQPGQLKLIKTEQWSVFAPPVLHAVVANRRLVLLGDPGSGKSTFVNHLLLCLAAHGLDPEDGWLERLPRWPVDEADLVPIPVLLRDFARSLPRDRGDGAANPLLLWRFLMKRLADQKLEAVGDALHDALDSGRAILLLDGLDEVPTSDERRRVRAIVDAVARRYPAARLLVTCRTLSYQDPTWQLDGLPFAELAPFDEPRIERFIAAWYAELRRMGIVRPDEAGPLALALRDAVHRKDLWRLAPNPLLLTVMALIHTHKGRLPDARARLYEDTVDLLLWRWDELRTSGAGEELGLRKLLRNANCQDVDLHRTLWQLAYEAHAQAEATEGDALADIAEHRLETALAQLHPQKSRDWAMQVIEVMKLRAGLLLERAPGVYTFPHRTFQEYLAGAYLAARANFATEVSGLDVTQWREVILLAVGRLVYVNLEIDRPLLLALALCGDEHAGGRAGVQRASFAADVLLEIGIERVQQVPQGIDIANRVRRLLRGILDNRSVLPSLRIVAGDRLGRIGDPRFDPERFELPADPFEGLVEIPEGPYEVPATSLLDGPIALMEKSIAGLCAIASGYDAVSLYLQLRNQSTRFKAVMRSRCLRKLAFGLLSPSEELEQLTGQLHDKRGVDRFFIARYPVTEAQFDRYLTATGRISTRRTRRGKNYPVVDVSFEEALAYCAWLTDRLAFQPPDVMMADPLVHAWRLLPCSRTEWEKALFRGHTLFPWGDDMPFDASNSGLGTVAPVGATPGARSHDGIDDLLGNVWEYMRDHGGRTVSGGCVPASTVESLFEQNVSDRSRTGFRLVLTREPWTPLDNPDTPGPPDPPPVRAALRRP